MSNSKLMFYCPRTYYALNVRMCVYEDLWMINYKIDILDCFFSYNKIILSVIFTNLPSVFFLLKLGKYVVGNLQYLY